MAKRCHACRVQLTSHGKWTYCKDCKAIVLKIQATVQQVMAAAGLRVPKGIPCSRCKKSWATVFDHRYYARPYAVDPVCLQCNNALGPALDVPRLVAAWRKFFK